MPLGIISYHPYLQSRLGKFCILSEFKANHPTIGLCQGQIILMGQGQTTGDGNSQFPLANGLTAIMTEEDGCVTQGTTGLTSP